MIARSADVVIVGGGAAGTSIAWQLARRGAGRIVLLEKQGIASGGTGWSSSIIRQHYTHEVLARMALESLRVFQNFEDRTGASAEFHQTGFLVLVKPEDVDSLRANVAMHQQIGIGATILSPDDVRALEPRIHHDDIVAAAWEPESGYADPVAVTNGYASAAKVCGAEFHLDVEAQRLVAGPEGVEAVVTDRGTIATRTVVVAAGYRTRELVAPLGVDLPITPIRHDIAVVARTPDFGDGHPIISDRINGSYFRPEGADLTMIGATAAHEGHEDANVEHTREPYEEDAESLIFRFWKRFPDQADATLRKGYTGVYDCTPDLQPLLGPVAEAPGLFVAAGFSGHGFKLSPMVGLMVAEAIIDGHASTVDIAFFSPNRFALGRPIDSTRAYSVGTLG